MKLNLRTLLIISTLMAAVLACSLGGGSSSTENRQATVDAISQSILSTATVTAEYAANPGAPVQTVAAQATARSEEIIATQAAQASASEEIQSATATAFSPMIKELERYGIDPTKGRPGWIHPPTTIEIDGYRQYDYANEFLNTVVEDFVVSADITWNTQYGGSGCGFVLRSDGKEDVWNQYVAVITRGSSGHMVFGTMADGEVVNVRDAYAYGIDPEFDWKNDTTNRLTVVGRGQTFSIYSNGTHLGDIDPSVPPKEPLLPDPPPAPPPGNPKAMAAYIQAKGEYDNVVGKIRGNYHARLRILQDADTVFDRGFVAMVALADSGKTTCDFDNAWLWLIEE
jgi:hypothetical protein